MTGPEELREWGCPIRKSGFILKVYIKTKRTHHLLQTKVTKKLNFGKLVVESNQLISPNS